MSMTSQVKQPILHKAEEHGQARELTIREVGAYTFMSGLKGLILGLAGSTLYSVLRGVTGDLTMADVGLSWLGFGTISTAWHLLADLDALTEGLKSWRSIETYAPPVPEVQQQANSPIVVKPYGGEPYILNGEKRSIALPDGRQGLALNPPTLEAVLKEVLQRHDGQWSRRRLMAIRVSGQRVTRALYEEMTDALTRAGFLQPQPNGGYALPGDVGSFADLQRYLPRLGGREGGREGGNPVGKEALPGPPGEGEPLTLAERHRLERFNELDHGVRSHLNREDKS